MSIGSTSGGNFTTSGTINHTNSVTAKTTQGLYPITFDAQGHITGAGSVITPAAYSVLAGTSSSACSFSTSPTILGLTIRQSSSNSNSVTLSYSTSGGLSINGKYFDSSDIRLKQNIKELISISSLINEIPIVEFEYKHNKDHKFIGTIAQKLLPLFPELVSKDSDGYYNVDYGGLAAIAIQGLKELSQKVKYLEDKLNGNSR